MAPLSKRGLRDLIADFVGNYPTHTKAAIVRHFKPHGISRSTVYAILDKLQTRGNVKHAGKGRIAKKMPVHLRKKVIRAATGKLGVSQRLLARKF